MDSPLPLPRINKECPRIGRSNNERRASLYKHGPELVYLYHRLIIFSIFLTVPSYFEAALTNDGSFTLIMKLWARWTCRPPSPNLHLPRDTMLFCEVLRVSISKGNTHGVQAELVKEVEGNSDYVAAFITISIRNAISSNVSLLSVLTADDQILTPSILLLDKLLGGSMGGVDEKLSVFGPVFLNDPKLDPRPLLITVLAKYSGLCKEFGHNAPTPLRNLLSATFEVCSTLLWYEGSIEFAVQLLDGGLLDAIANLVPTLKVFSKRELSVAAFLLQQNIATFLSHAIVISAAKNALHRLEKERKADYEALGKMKSPLGDAWRYFRGHAFERATLKGIYEAKFRKEDKLSCDSVCNNNFVLCYILLNLHSSVTLE